MGGTIIRRRAQAIVLIATGSVLLVSASAQAGIPGATVSLGSKGSLEYLRASIGGVSSQDGPFAQCDSGDSTVSGGGTISGGGATSALNATYPLGSPAWRTEGRTTGAGTRTVTSYVVCGEQPTTWSSAPYLLEAAGDPVGGDVRVLTGACGADNDIGGGVDAAGDVRLVENRPSSDWTTTAQNHSGAPLNVDHWYGCSSAYESEITRKAARVNMNRSGTVTVGCRKSQAVIAGGFQISGEAAPPRDVWATSTRPVDSKKDRRRVPDDGWRATIFNGSGGGVDLTTYALCSAL